jgi:hypothetical protein
MECNTQHGGARPEDERERYEPPAVEWEEPFDPVAASGCCIPLVDPSCDNPC